MPSLRSQFFSFVLRHRHLLRFRLRAEEIDWTTPEAVLRFRETCEEGARKFGKIPPEIKVEPTTIEGLRAEWILPAGATKDRVIFFAHGGGYVSGSCSDHRTHVAKFVRGTGVGALLYEYRLAPEHPYPAALEDSLTAYQWLLDRGVASSNIVFAGDSAGGGLALALLLAARDRGIPLPAAAVALSPWTDLTCSGESYRTNAGKCLSPEGSWTAFSAHYVGDQDPEWPWISPLFGDLRGLPPLYLSVGEDEILLDDAVSFARKAEESGVKVTLRIGKRLFHCYPVFAPLFPEATRAMDEICASFRTHLTR